MIVYLLVTAVAFGVALAGMAVGVILSNRRIKGSCGGLASFKDSDGNSICEACSNPSPDCRGEPGHASADSAAPEESTPKESTVGAC